jgi:hypothetical protein
VVRAGAAQESSAHPPGVVEYLIVHEGEFETGLLEETVALGPGDFAGFVADPQQLAEAAGAEVAAVAEDP